MKKLAGAIYTESVCSLATVKKSIVHLCVENRDQIAKKKQRPLPDSTKTYRGNYYHIMDMYCYLHEHGPPKHQEPFKIMNVSEFMKVLNNAEFEVKVDYVDQMAVAKEEEELDFKRILTCSEDRCNQLEYERLSLYHTLNRMRADFVSSSGDVMMTEHAYGNCLRKSKGVNTEFEIVFLWIFLWMAVIIRGVKRAGWIRWSILKTILVLGGLPYIGMLARKILDLGWNLDHKQSPSQYLRFT